MVQFEDLDLVILRRRILAPKDLCHLAYANRAAGQVHGSFGLQKAQASG
jgi:hypothetical protein